MISVKKEYKKSIPSILSGIQWEKKIKKVLLGKKVSGGGWNWDKKNEVRERLIKLYHGKCAYCESEYEKPEIEHYRPKNRPSLV